jgi:hypothetical protein
MLGLVCVEAMIFSPGWFKGCAMETSSRVTFAFFRDPIGDVCQAIQQWNAARRTCGEELDDLGVPRASLLPN